MNQTMQLVSFRHGLFEFGLHYRLDLLQHVSMPPEQLGMALEDLDEAVVGDEAFQSAHPFIRPHLSHQLSLSRC